MKTIVKFWMLTFKLEEISYFKEDFSKLNTEFILHFNDVKTYIQAIIKNLGNIKLNQEYHHVKNKKNLINNRKDLLEAMNNKYVIQNEKYFKEINLKKEIMIDIIDKIEKKCENITKIIQRNSKDIKIEKNEEITESLDFFDDIISCAKVR